MEEQKMDLSTLCLTTLAAIAIFTPIRAPRYYQLSRYICLDIFCICCFIRVVRYGVFKEYTEIWGANAGTWSSWGFFLLCFDTVAALWIAVAAVLVTKSLFDRSWDVEAVSSS